MVFMCLSVTDSSLPVLRHILTGECQSGRMCKFERDTVVIRTREVGEKIKTEANRS